MSARPPALHHPAARAYRELRDALAPQGQAEPGLAWVRSGAVNAVALPLPGGPTDLLEISLHPDAGPGDVPRRWHSAGRSIRLAAARAARPCVQVASAFNPGLNGGMGTVTGLFVHQLQPDRHYLVSSGHVLAPPGRPGIGDRIEVDCRGTQGTARLAGWQPDLGDGALKTGIDAGIAVVEGGLLQALRQLPQPNGISSQYYLGGIARVQTAGGVREGRLRSVWSGYVDIAGYESSQDYWLTDGIGYHAEPAPIPGDSGAAVWDGQGNLMGLHTAGPLGDEAFRSNAVFCPIEPVMRWFRIVPLTVQGVQPAVSAPKPVLKDTPNGPPAVISPPQPPAVAAGSTQELAVVAKTLWGEARGEPEEGMKAVACVIGTRKRRSYRGKKTFADVCLDRWQFSCWNERDPNRPRLDLIERKPDAAYQRALQIAADLLAGKLADFTFGATHYFASSLRQRPPWARGKSPCYCVGNHWFYNNID